MRPLAFFLVLAWATAVLAHEGVKNPAVVARMHGMKLIGQEVKVIGDMAKGEAPFDAARAQSAAVEIARHAREAPGLFEAVEDDPKSEALPAIWESYDDFVAKAGELESVAAGLSTSIVSEADLQPAVQALVQSCKSCHSRYRK